MEEGKGGTRHRASTFFIFLVIYINESEKMHLRVFSNIDLTEPEPTALPIFNNLEFATRSITLKTEARKKNVDPTFRLLSAVTRSPPNVPIAIDHFHRITGSVSPTRRKIRPPVCVGCLRPYLERRPRQSSPPVCPARACVARRADDRPVASNRPGPARR